MIYLPLLGDKASNLFLPAVLLSGDLTLVRLDFGGLVVRPTDSLVLSDSFGDSRTSPKGVVLGLAVSSGSILLEVDWEVTKPNK